ncbi:hypothetical protein ACSAZL_00110 [Methanosarcina sp. T3]|uniref:hypothetical protein n=1 Tax=Methanosarcina sp. T3 TaxID=3439062 RepID=UPI003F85EEBF
MKSSNRNIKLTIKGENEISVPYLVETLQHIQNAIYQIGDHLVGNPARQKGDFPKPVKEYCTLLITELEKGSIHATMEVADGQIRIESLQTLGEESLCVTEDLLVALSKANVSEEDLHSIIRDQHRVNKILREFYSMWPDEESKLSISFAFGKDKNRELNPKQKGKIESLLNKAPEECEKEVFGRLVEVRVDKKRSIQIDSVEGIIKCKYTPDIEDLVTSSLGKFVRVRGKTSPTSTGTFVLEIDQENCLEPLSHYNLRLFKKDNVIRKLEKAVNIELYFENDYYIASNDDLGLLSAQPTLKQAIEGVKEELTVLWSEYVETEENTLTKSGKILRDKLLQIVGESYVQL